MAPSSQQSHRPFTTSTNSSARSYRRSCSMCLSRLKLSAALLEELVTTFHAARPLLMWSIEANVRATWYGSPKVVETVAPRPMRRVDALSAEINVVGSKRHRKEG